MVKMGEGEPVEFPGKVRRGSWEIHICCHPAQALPHRSSFSAVLARSHAGNCILTGRRFPALRHYCVATDAALIASTISAATADVATAAASTAAATRVARLMSITDYQNTHLTQYSTIIPPQ